MQLSVRRRMRRVSMLVNNNTNDQEEAAEKPRSRGKYVVD